MQGVVKAYGSLRANDGIDVTVGRGEVLGVLGPNGAGKTTLVRQVLGLVKPDSGSIRIGGIDVVADPRAAHRLCSYQPQTHVPFTGLRARRVIELLARMHGASKADARRRAAELLERLDLGAIADRRVDDASGGTARLVGFAAAIARPGEVVVLDEPTNDVDPLRRRVLWDLVRETAEAGATIILVTHNVHEAERAVDHLAIIDAGRVAASGRPADLRRRHPHPDATLEDVYIAAVQSAA